MDLIFMPHGHCYYWEPWVMWSHAIPDSIIALAYFFIPLNLVYIFRRRREFTYIWIAICFAIFIWGCGATHVMDVINIWEPYYRLDSGIRIVTALASIGTAFILFKVTPAVVVIPTKAEWEKVNEELKTSNENLQQTVTDLVDAQEMLEKMNQSLEEKVKARTQELENKNAQLSQINFELDNFIYVASHDLKAPVANLEGLINIAEDKASSDEELVNLFSFIKTSVHKLDNTIEELSDINRIHRTVGKDIRTLDLEEILQEVENSVSELIKESKARIQKELHVTRVYFSHTGLRSILYNLISNSLKYRSADRPLDIRITSIVEGQHHKITVSDNGIGFDMSKKDIAFSLFKRLHAHVEGSGMGLYMVKRIMEQLDGNVEVESEIDKGTTFYLYLKKSRQ